VHVCFVCGGEDVNACVWSRGKGACSCRGHYHLPLRFPLPHVPPLLGQQQHSGLWRTGNRVALSPPLPPLPPPSFPSPPSTLPPLPLPSLPSLLSYLFCQCLLPGLVPIQLCHAEYHEGPGYLCVGCVYVCVYLFKCMLRIHPSY